MQLFGVKHLEPSNSQHLTAFLFLKTIPFPGQLSRLVGLLQPRESKVRTKGNAQAHKSSSEFEIAALL